MRLLGWLMQSRTGLVAGTRSGLQPKRVPRRGFAPRLVVHHTGAIHQMASATRRGHIAGLTLLSTLLGACMGEIDAAGESMMSGSAPAASGDSYILTSDNRVLSFVAATGEVVSSMDILGLGEDDQIVGGDFRPADSNLYALTRSGKLYVFDLRRAALVVRATLTADPADT